MVQGSQGCDILFYFILFCGNFSPVKKGSKNLYRKIPNFDLFLIVKKSTIAYNSKECFKTFYFHILNIAKFG
jgi:hypothetical protein